MKRCSSYIKPESLISKGCDASNVFDEEVPAENLDYSDDEEEMMAKQKIKKGRRKAGGIEVDGAPRPGRGERKQKLSLQNFRSMLVKKLKLRL